MEEIDYENILYKLNDNCVLDASEKAAIDDLFEVFSCGDLTDITRGGLEVISKVIELGDMPDKHVECIFKGLENINPRDEFLNSSTGNYVYGMHESIEKNTVMMDRLFDEIKASNIDVISSSIKYFGNPFTLPLIDKLDFEEKVALLDEAMLYGDFGLEVGSVNEGSRKVIESTLSLINLPKHIYDEKKMAVKSSVSALSDDSLKEIFSEFKGGDFVKFLADNWDNMEVYQRYIVTDHVMDVYLSALSVEGVALKFDNNIEHYGSYDNVENTVSINYSKLNEDDCSDKKFVELLSTAIHEANHKWQYSAISGDSVLDDNYKIVMTLSALVYQDDDYFDYIANLHERDSRGVAEYFSDILIEEIYKGDQEECKKLDNNVDQLLGGVGMLSVLKSKEYFKEIDLDITCCDAGSVRLKTSSESKVDDCVVKNR